MTGIPHHMTTSALVRAIVAGAPTAEDQADLEAELDLRVPMPEVRSIVQITATLAEGADQRLVVHHCSVVEKAGGAEIDYLEDGVVVTCELYALAGTLKYLRECGVFNRITHEIKEAR